MAVLLRRFHEHRPEIETIIVRQIPTVTDGDLPVSHELNRRRVYALEVNVRQIAVVVLNAIEDAHARPLKSIDINPIACPVTTITIRDHAMTVDGSDDVPLLSRRPSIGTSLAKMHQLHKSS